jgi:hypothetical protein
MNKTKEISQEIKALGNYYKLETMTVLNYNDE